ncbi:Transthyretin-like protein 46 [Aphelenchoides besseyi]|nr:Transthyretin-like protein 46 [Aphelenchoides besseyi]
MMKVCVLLCLFGCALAAIIPEQHSGIQSFRVTGKLLCDSSGQFDLSGDTTEMTTIDVNLKIYHDCNDDLIPCQRRWKFELPNNYITSGKTPMKTLDIGTWNLEAILPGENHDCIH